MPMQHRLMAYPRCRLQHAFRIPLHDTMSAPPHILRKNQSFCGVPGGQPLQMSMGISSQPLILIRILIPS